MSRNTPKSHRRLDHISTEDVRNCIAGTCDCWHRMSRELAALRLRVEELTRQRDAALSCFGRWGKIEFEQLTGRAESAEARVEELTHERDQLRAGMTPEAHARVGGTVDRLLEVIDQWRTRAEKAERELGEARQAPKIELEQETDGRWLAEYKEIPGMMVYGATIGEALRKLADLIQQSEERAFEIT